MHVFTLLGICALALAQTPSTTTTASAAPAEYTVGPGQLYTNITAAYDALPNDGNSYTIYILAGLYIEQFNITRTGGTAFRGETSFPNDFSQNLVTVQISNGQLTSNNQDETTPWVYRTPDDWARLTCSRVIGVKKSSSDLSGVGMLLSSFPRAVETGSTCQDMLTAARSALQLESTQHIWSSTQFGCFGHRLEWQEHRSIRMFVPWLPRHLPGQSGHTTHLQLLYRGFD